MSCCNKNKKQYYTQKTVEDPQKVTLHEKKQEKHFNENYSISNTYHGEERSVKDLQMLRQFSCNCK